MGFKNNSNLARELLRVRKTLKLKRKDFFKTIVMPQGADLQRGTEPGVKSTVILDGFYPLPGGKSGDERIIMFCKETSFAVMALVISVSYPLLADVSVSDMVRFGCSTQEELEEELRKQNPAIAPEDIVTIIRCEIE